MVGKMERKLIGGGVIRQLFAGGFTVRAYAA
jgi:hypothetical protein